MQTIAYSNRFLFMIAFAFVWIYRKPINAIIVRHLNDSMKEI
ncbi:MAG: hypothetical protein ACO3AF_06775 [Flavobacteriales bacterium]